MKKIKVKLELMEGMLGTSPNNEEIYTDFVASKAPDAASREQEIEALGADGYVEKGLTVFPRDEHGNPIVWDYQIKGFMKDTCSALSRLSKKNDAGKKQAANESGKLTAFKKIIDGLIFPQPRMIPIMLPDGAEITYCQRPLRAQTPKGERIGLAISEEVPAGSTLEFDVVCLDDDHVPAVLEWLDYGQLRGLGQWRNSGKGRFTYIIEGVE